jgi:hypothetical protein
MRRIILAPHQLAVPNLVTERIKIKCNALRCRWRLPIIGFCKQFFASLELMTGIVTHTSKCFSVEWELQVTHS